MYTSTFTSVNLVALYLCYIHNLLKPQLPFTCKRDSTHSLVSHPILFCYLYYLCTNEHIFRNKLTKYLILCVRCSVHNRCCPTYYTLRFLHTLFPLRTIFYTHVGNLPSHMDYLWWFLFLNTHVCDPSSPKVHCLIVSLPLNIKTRILDRDEMAFHECVANVFYIIYFKFIS